MTTLRILVVEDQEQKYAQVAKALHDALPDADLVRTETVTEAEDMLLHPYDFVVLDISMNISPTSAAFSRGGHADLGGLDLVEYMYLNEIETPVIVVTGFDFFRVQPVQGVTELIGLEDLEQAIREKIGKQLITLVRFGSAGWADQMKSAVTGEGTAS